MISKVKSMTYIKWLIRRDMPGVLEIEQLCYPKYCWTEKDFILALQDRSTIGLVITYNDIVVGFVVYKLYKTYIEILNLAVHPSCWRQKFGTLLIEKLKSELHIDKRTKLTTIISESNTEAHLFFKSVRFVATKIQKCFFENSEEDSENDSDGITFELEIE